MSRAPRRSLARITLRTLGIVVLAMLALMLGLALVPASAGDVGSSQNPASNYADAVARFRAIEAAESREGVYEPCRSRLLDHGRRQEVAVVLVHGLTNCPRQFLELGEQIHASGANALILRLPRHGRADASGARIGGVSEVAGLEPQELAGYADRAVDIAEGLGGDVRVLGLSMGGVVAAWIAQNRSVDRVVAVAPAISLPHMPGFVDSMFRNLFSRLPNISLPGSGLDHSYAGESTAALASMYLLADSVRDAATESSPAARSIVVVTNANDGQVDNGDIAELVEAWRAREAEVTTYEFPEALGLPHDVVDVQQPDAQPDAVYPILVGALGFGG
jgi:carboxylesterase